ncbi:unnamed protein product [Arabidopsis thaliana]|uniref:Fatty acid desaturase 4-like 2, chloroplastic n=3 Tax=Arabidopsis thaliana TaxID=3702 RepID=FD4L2_ARATH|nr:Kua-ubiquitin conjugating enzyme hybrid localization domain-containing protein [Arabidopsis thaliana]O81006.1 RecName: Full=Fatty acid desaturase 4-like 2, chloroplastic; Short=FAD4-L2; Flags: Precursor [Arabidopsis thaliana]AAC32436.1 unknown protein [Arabidopsis thaliana]AEC07369.1 Kua-ubiquitin conjugating enzyme hybrid localization domain-containing protein [Arabidopsis thaliana]CAA0369970.1 unnamed protein product [Arabidopsis thaliana]CAD5319247.1 unnamed protein product [Arabidopsis |eukprot:NP_179874.1 Kua-ubiquitin conjugating enzyme hybrid localization domain-containing protein [Arabidopsis thaliana]
MATSLQTKYTLNPITNNIPRSHRPSFLRVTSTTNSQPNHEMKLVVEQRLVNPPLSNDPTLQSTWTHRLWVAAGCTTVFVSFSKSIIGAFGSHLWLEPSLAGFAGYILADLGSGVYHWATDNYGDESTPLVGIHIEDSQDHHKCPWTITKRQFANNLHFMARGTTLIVLPLDLAFDDHVVHGFVSMFAFCVLFCQLFHAWAHGTKSKLPPLVVGLQDIGLLVSRIHHMNHHRAPYNNNYCVVSGVWNKVLDESNVFKAMEMVLYIQLGVRPRSWTEPNYE